MRARFNEWNGLRIRNLMPLCEMVSKNVNFIGHDRVSEKTIIIWEIMIVISKTGS
jgi:hypothetical protein